MSDELPPGFIDIRGKKQLTCTKCGYEDEFTPRTISMEKLKYMADVEKVYSVSNDLVARARELKPGFLNVTISNTLMVTCLSCGNVMHLFDEFSSISEVVGPRGVMRPPKNQRATFKR